MAKTPDETPTPKKEPLSTEDTIAAKDAEISALKAKLAEPEPEPKPFLEYPKWVTTPSGETVIVPDKATEDAVMAGSVKPPEVPKSAQGLATS